MAASQVEPLEQVGRARAGPPAAEVEQVGHQAEVLLAGEQVVDGGELPGDADRGANRVGFAWPGRARRRATSPPSAGMQRGEDVDGGGLAGAVRAEQGEDRSLRHGQVEAVEHEWSPKDLRSPVVEMAAGTDLDMALLSVGGGRRAAQARRTTMSP